MHREAQSDQSSWSAWSGEDFECAGRSESSWNVHVLRYVLCNQINSLSITIAEHEQFSANRYDNANVFSYGPKYKASAK